MDLRRTLPALLLALACGCGGESAPSDGVAPLSRTSFIPADLPEPVQFEAGRNFTEEYSEFMRLVSRQHSEPKAVRQALAVAPSEQFEYTTVAGAPMRVWRFDLQGPAPGAPFFEAFGPGYAGRSFFVFFEKTWFSWRAVDCGFHESDAFRGVASAL